MAATSQKNPPKYYYTGDSPSLKFELNPFIVKDPSCEITYSCQLIQGPVKLDLCYIDEQGTFAKFDTATGNYIFQSTNRDKYPPGEYIFMIYGTSGSMTAHTRMKMTLVDHPCSRVELKLRENPFEDITYVLGERSKRKKWNKEQLVEKPIFYDLCGEV